MRPGVAAGPAFGSAPTAGAFGSFAAKPSGGFGGFASQSTGGGFAAAASPTASGFGGFGGKLLTPLGSIEDMGPYVQT